jgi:hypothetical protein
MCFLLAEVVSVVERAHPRSPSVTTSLDVNHSGVAAVAAASVRSLHWCATVVIRCVAARVASSLSNCLIHVVYRPGFTAVSASFLSELDDILQRNNDFHGVSYICW